MTFFQKRVYEVVRSIEKGKTMSYKEVAEKAGSPRAWRAVGSILRENHDSDIPCHRVIKSDGKPGGYNGGEKEKELRLMAEDATVDNGGTIKYTIIRKSGGGN